MTHPPLTDPRLRRNRIGRPRSRQTTAKAAGIEPPLCGNRRATTPATSTATMAQHLQDSRTPTAPPLHHREVAAASTNRRRVRVVSRRSATGRRLGSIRRRPRQQPAGMRAEQPPGPRRHHVETYPRARAGTWHKPADSAAFVAGASLGRTLRWLLWRHPCRGQRRPVAHGQPCCAWPGWRSCSGSCCRWPC